MAIDNAHFAIIVDLRRLPDYDGTDLDKHVWLGATVQAGIGAFTPEQDLKPFFADLQGVSAPAESATEDDWKTYERRLSDSLAPLIPWYWNMPVPRLFGWKGNNGWKPIENTEIVRLDKADAQYGGDQTAWDAYRKRLLTIADNRTGGPAASYTDIEGYRILVASKGQDPAPPLHDKVFNWAGFLGARSQQPGWLAHSNTELSTDIDGSKITGGPQLAYLLRTPRDNLYAPNPDPTPETPPFVLKFQKLVLVFQATTPVLFDKNELSGPIDLMQAEAGSFNGKQVAFYVRPIDPERMPTATGSYLDINSLLVGKQPYSAPKRDLFLVDRDWLRDLPLTLARAADLPSLLLTEYERAGDFSGGGGKPAPFPPDNDAENCRVVLQGLLVLLRDVAGSGAKASSKTHALTGPDSVNLAMTMLKAVPADASAKKAYLALKSWDYEVDDKKWWTILLSTVPGLRELCGPKGDAMPDGAILMGMKPADRTTRLRGIYAAVVDETILRELVLAQWDAAMAASTDVDVKAFWSTNRTVIRDALAKIQVRDRLLLDNLGLLWPSLLKTMHADRMLLPQRARLEKGARAAIEEYVHWRLTGEDPKKANPYAVRFRPWMNSVLPKDWLREVEQGISDSFAATALNAMPRDSEAEIDHEVQIGDGSETPLPHPLVIQVDQVAADTVAPRDDEDALTAPMDDDYLKFLAGYGLFIRRRRTLDDKTNAWRALSFARIDLPVWPPVTVPPPPGPPREPISLSHGTVVAFAVGYENGSRRALIEYDERPLFGAHTSEVADTPTSGAALQASVAAPVKLPGKSPVKELGPMVQLAFGSYYDTISMGIENCGAFPVRFANEKKPMLLRYPLEDLDVPRQGYAPLEHLRTVRYLRRVGIGPITQKWDASSETSTSLVFPSEVQTKSAELLAMRRRRDPHADVDTKVCLLTTMEKEARGVRQQVSLTLVPPVCHFSTFDRWRAADDTGPESDWRKRRIAVRTAWWEDRLAPGTKRSGASDHIIEDPAVEALIVKVNRLDLDGSAVPGNPESDAGHCVVILDRSTPPGDRFKLTWSDANLKTTITVLPTNEVTATYDKELGIRIVVPAEADGGQYNPVYLLRVYPAVKVELFDKPVGAAAREDRARIHPYLQLAPDPDLDPSKWKPKETFKDRVTGQVYTLFAPFQLCLEVVSPDLPTEAELFEAFMAGYQVVLTADRERRLVRAWLEKPANGDPGRALMDNVGRMDVRWQVHRWDGRPVTPLPPLPVTDPNKPSPPAASPLEDIGHWDVEGFGWRYDYDAAAAIRQLTLVTKPLAFEEDRTGDVQARYYRIAATAISRYRWIFQHNDKTVRAARAADKRQWKRVLVPAKPSRIPDPPAVKLVLPLTRSASNPEARSADLLVVVNETWGQAGGVLAERLQAEVGVAYVKFPGEQEALVKPELGPDPILWGDLKRPNPGTPPDQGFNITNLPRIEVVGPLGHTFDTDASAPLFVGTSFIVKAPDENEIERPWSMMKLRFQRIVLPELVAAMPLAGPLLVGSQPQHATWKVDKNATLKTKVRIKDASATEIAVVKIDTPAVDFEGAARQGALPGTFPNTDKNAYEVRMVASRVSMGFESIEVPAPGDVTKTEQIAVGIFDVTISVRIPTPPYASDVDKAIARRRAEWVRVARTELRVPGPTPPQGVALDARISLTFDGPGPASAGDAYVSSYTSGHWCQVLPGDAFTSLANRDDKKLEFRTWRLSRGPGGTWKINPATALRGRRKLADPAVAARESRWSLFHWIVVTRPVSSGDGNPDHEAYVGVLEATGAKDDEFKMLGDDNNPEGSNYYGRILDMQMDPRHAAEGVFDVTDKDPWALVFGESKDTMTPYEANEDNAGADAKVRVLKIYPRFGGEKP